jgi:hypothetical protein
MKKLFVKQARRIDFGASTRLAAKKPRLSAGLGNV